MNPFARLFEFIGNPSHSRTWTLLGFFILILAIPLTVNIAQKQQELRQHAAETETEEVCVDVAVNAERCLYADLIPEYTNCHEGGNADCSTIPRLENRPDPVPVICGESKRQCTEVVKQIARETSAPAASPSPAATQTQCESLGYTCVSNEIQCEGKTCTQTGTSCANPSTGLITGVCYAITGGTPPSSGDNLKPLCTGTCTGVQTCQVIEGGRIDTNERCEAPGTACCKPISCPNPGYIPNTTNNNEDWGGDCNPGDGKGYNTGDPTTCTIAGCDFYPKANRYCWHNTGKEYADPAGCAKYNITVQPKTGSGTPATSQPGVSTPTVRVPPPGAGTGVSCSSGVATCTPPLVAVKWNNDGKFYCTDSSTSLFVSNTPTCLTGSLASSPKCPKTNNTTCIADANTCGPAGKITHTFSGQNCTSATEFETCNTAPSNCSAPNTCNSSRQCVPQTQAPGTGQTGNTQLTFSIGLDGIGTTGDRKSRASSSGSNKNPRTPSKSFTIEIFDSSNNLVKTVGSGLLTSTTTPRLNYNSSSGKYEGSVLVDLTTSTTYSVKIQGAKYLKKRLGTVTGGQPNALTGDLVAGAMAGNNFLSTADYGNLIGCLFKPLQSTITFCNLADLDDTGAVDQFDYNLFIREIAEVQNGD